MPNPHPRERTPGPALLSTVLLAAALMACGGGDPDGGADYAADFEDGGDAPSRIDVDPCALLTRDEISEQLYLSIPLSQREHYKTDEFDVQTAPADYGESRMCAYRFQSRDSVGGGPTWHSDFDLLVFPAIAVVLPEDRREPVAGAGAGTFKERTTGGAYYVVKGELAVSITRFPGRPEEAEGGSDAGHAVLLRRIAERLP